MPTIFKIKIDYTVSIYNKSMKRLNNIPSIAPKIKGGIF